jgi:hypothetical protein
MRLAILVHHAVYERGRGNNQCHVLRNAHEDLPRERRAELTERKSKYNAKPTTTDGIRFDSKSEERRYNELLLLERSGVISDLKLQPSFELQPAFDYNGEKIRSIKYVADFSYKNSDGTTTIEDVKGMKTEVYKLKRKLFLNAIKAIDWIDFVEVSI